MIYGIWNFSSAPIPAAHARDLVTVCAATKLTGIFDEQPATPPAAPNYATPPFNRHIRRYLLRSDAEKVP